MAVVCWIFLIRKEYVYWWLFSLFCLKCVELYVDYWRKEQKKLSLTSMHVTYFVLKQVILGEKKCLVAVAIFLYVLIFFFSFLSLLGTTYSAVEFHRAPFCQPYFAVYAMETWKTNYSVECSRMGRDALFCALLQ